MAAYTTIVSSRTTDPDIPSLLTTMRVADPTIGIQWFPGTFTYTLKKSTAWTPTQITQATNAINNAVTATSETIAQSHVDNMSIFEKAFLLTLLDQINVLRTAAGLATVTPAQAIQAVRDKAATL